MLTAVPQQDAGHFDEPKVVGSLLLVTHQQRSALREPAQCAFHHPPPRQIALIAGFIELLLPDAPDVAYVISLLHKLPSSWAVIVALVQAKVLGRFLRRRLQALGRYGVERSLQELI